MLEKDFVDKIIEAPDDENLWSVFADWLSDAGDTRGELILLDLDASNQGSSAAVQQRIEEIVERSQADWLGPGFAKVWSACQRQVERGFFQQDDLDQLLQYVWKRGFLSRVTINVPAWRGPSGLDILREVIQSPAARLLSDVAVGALEARDHTGGPSTCQEAITVLTSQSLPLKRLHLGAFDPSDQAKLARWTVGELSSILEAFPRLQDLHVQGVDAYFSEDAPAHQSLRKLRMETLDLAIEGLDPLIFGKFPSLESLALWCGNDGAGIGGMLMMLGQATPNLRELSLRNSENTDQLVAGLTHSPIAPGLEVLDLSVGNLSDLGAGALVDMADNLGQLKMLDLRDCELSPEAATAIQARFGPKVRLGGNQRQADGEWNEGDTRQRLMGGRHDLGPILRGRR